MATLDYGLIGCWGWFGEKDEDGCGWEDRNGWVGVDFFSLIVNNIRKILFLQLLFYLHQFGQNWSMSNSSVAQTENQGKICKKVLELSIFPKYESYSTQIGPFPC